MTQEKAIKIWLEGAEDALDTCNKIFKSKKYHHALFFLHLALEKIIKAFYIFKLDTSPPYTHNLKDLCLKMKLKLSVDQLAELDEISEFNVSARYEEYKFKIYKRATKEYSEKWMKIGRDYYKFFKKEL